MPYSVKALKVGEQDAHGPQIFWMGGWDEWLTLSFTVLLIRGEGITALINAGPPADITAMNEATARVLGERARMRVADEDRIERQLDALGVAPDEVTHLIVTPFQPYSIGGLRLFPNAQICFSKRGWIHFHTTHDHPHDRRWQSIPQDLLVHLVTDAWDRVRLLEDEDEIAPGLRTWWAGAHHRATIAVEVDTSQGTVVASDAFLYYENVEDPNRPLGVSENMYEAMAAAARARQSDHVVPLFDPRVFDRHPSGEIG